MARSIAVKIVADTTELEKAIDRCIVKIMRSGLVPWHRRARWELKRCAAWIRALVSL